MASLAHPARHLAPTSRTKHLKPEDASTARGHLIASVTLTLLSAICFSALVLLDYFTGMEPSAAVVISPVPLVLACSALYFARVKVRPALACGCAILFSVIMLAMYGLDVGYAVHRAGRHYPLVDDRLAAIDRSLGFDWMAVFRFFVDHPLFTKIVRVPYDTTKEQMIVAIGAMMLMGHHNRALKLTSANSISLLLVHVVALFLPALGTYAYAGLDLADHLGVDLTTRAAHVPSLLASRMSLAPDLDGFQRFGIVTFPSYHTVTIVLFVWAFWPDRVLRWPAIIWNMIVLVAVPVHGSHYLCDIVGGLLVAAFSIWLTSLSSTGQARSWIQGLRSLPSAIRSVPHGRTGPPRHRGEVWCHDACHAGRRGPLGPA